MKTKCGPHRRSAAYSALLILRQLNDGESSTMKQLSAAILSNFRSETRLQELVIRPLLEFKFIAVEDGRITLTKAGRDFMNPAAAKPANEAQPARPLTVPKQFQLIERRPGSLAYRDIPSLMGGERVDYAAKSLSGDSSEGVDVLP